MIRYTDSLDGIDAAMLGAGFFEGWPVAPTSEQHLEALRGSRHVVLAVDDAAGSVVGFVSAVGDGVLSAFVPLVEVLPPYRRRGIATEMMSRVLAALEGTYALDLVCDRALVPFYERFGLREMPAMSRRNGGALR